MDTLNTLLQALAEKLRPSDQDYAARREAISRLEAQLSRIFTRPAAPRLVPYGSFLTGCFGSSSDLDLALEGSVKRWPETRLSNQEQRQTVDVETVVEERKSSVYLSMLARALAERGAVQGSPDLASVRARVPVIKFKEAPSGVECSITLLSGGRELKGETVRLLQGLQPALAPLTRLVKAWAQYHDINDARNGTLNSWSLELLVIYSLQTHPSGPLLPPLWRLFRDSEPTAEELDTRPLAGWDASVAEALAGASARCGNLPRPPAAPPLASLVHWFLTCFTTLTTEWRDSLADPSGPHHPQRVSTWLGRTYDKPYMVPYIAPVEDPFDAADNTARTLGAQARHSDTLPYVAWVVGHSLDTLSAVASVEDSHLALLWLFGPAALPCLGVQALEALAPPVPRLVGHKPFQLQPDEMARLKLVAAGGPQPVGTISAFRKVLKYTNAGSPVISLEEWRNYLSQIGAIPPYAWHPLPRPVRQRGPARPPSGAGGAAIGTEVEAEAAAAAAATGMRATRTPPAEAGAPTAQAWGSAAQARAPAVQAWAPAMQAGSAAAPLAPPARCGNAPGSQARGLGTQGAHQEVPESQVGFRPAAASKVESKVGGLGAQRLWVCALAAGAAALAYAVW